MKVNPQLSKNDKKSENIFQYDSDKSNWLTVRSIINNSDTGVFVLDNCTASDYILIFDKDFAFKKGLIPNKNSESIARFQDSAEITLSFGSFIINSKAKGNRIITLPRKKDFEYSGIIGLGFLKNYIIEINYQDKYFIIDSTLSVDTANYYTLNLEHKAFWQLPIEFYIKGKKYSKKAMLDIGNEGRGFFWGSGAVKKVTDLKIDSSKLKTGVGTTTEETAIEMPFKFDSVSLPNNLIIKNINSTISFSSNGLSGSNIILFGNSFLSRFKKVYIDFKRNKLYLQKTK